MNHFLKDLINYLASSLASTIRENTLEHNCECGIDEMSIDVYLSSVNDMFKDLETEDSVYHMINTEDAKVLLTHDIYANFPLIDRLKTTNKISLLNTISMGIAAYFTEYKASQEIPEGPVEMPSVTPPSDATDDTTEDTSGTPTDDPTAGTGSEDTTTDTIPTV